MKRGLIIGIIIFIILISAISLLLFFSYVSFSETSGKVIDSKGNPIINAKVSISYLCRPMIGIAETPPYENYGIRGQVTDSKGEFNFNRLKVGFEPLVLCRKSIGTMKIGYCPAEGIGSTTCLREIQNLPDYIAPEIESFDYDVSYIGEGKSIGKSDKTVSLKLIKVDFPQVDVACNLFKNLCTKNDEFNDFLEQGISTDCSRGFISNEEKQNLIVACEQGAFSTDADPLPLLECLERYKSEGEYQFIWKDLNYECNTEIAYIKDDSSFCEKITEQDFKDRCHNFLALKLKDLSLCSGASEYHIKSCQYNIIKLLGDSSKCSLLSGVRSNLGQKVPSMKKECEIYFS